MKKNKEKKQKVRDLLLEKNDLDELTPKILQLKESELDDNHLKLLNRQHELNGFFELCYSKLSQDEQNIIRLYCTDGYADFEISIELGYSERKIWSMRQTAFSKLIEMIELFFN